MALGGGGDGADDDPGRALVMKLTKHAVKILNLDMDE